MAHDESSFPARQKNKMEFFVWRFYHERREVEHDTRDGHVLSKQDILERACAFPFASD